VQQKVWHGEQDPSPARRSARKELTVSAKCFSLSFARQCYWLDWKLHSHNPVLSLGEERRERSELQVLLNSLACSWGKRVTYPGHSIVLQSSPEQIKRGSGGLKRPLWLGK